MSTTIKSKHTPGPWRLGKYDKITTADGETLHVHGVSIPMAGYEGREAEFAANALLIAAAPAMLEALEYVASLTCGCQKAGDENWHSNRCAKPRVLAAIKLAVRG